MQLEEYFDFVSPDEVRLRGTRIGMEAVLAEYLDGHLAEEIVLNYPPLSLEQVHATITYYLRNRTAIEEYLSRWAARGEAAVRRQEGAPTPLLDRLARVRRSLAKA